MLINKLFCVTFLTSLFCIQLAVAEETEIFPLEAEENLFLKNGIEIANPHPFDIKVTKKCISKSELPSLEDNALNLIPGAWLNNINEDKPECHGYSLQSNIKDTGETAQLNIAVQPDLKSLPIESPFVTTDPAVFVFNSVRGGWSQPKTTLTGTKPTKKMATLADAVNKVMVGVIVYPDKLTADPSRITAKSLSDHLGSVKPIAGLMKVKAPTPDSRGSVQVEIPLMLRRERDYGPKPELKFLYNAATDLGLLGKGWDLNLTSIDVDTVSPLFDLNYETEDYRFGSNLLVPWSGSSGKTNDPLKRGGIIHPREDFKEFRARDNESGKIFRRYGKMPHEYRWIVYDPYTGFTSIFGGAEVTKASGKPDLNKDAVETGRGNAISKWYLTQVFDNQPAGNQILYRYMDRENGVGESHSVILESIVYNDVLNEAKALASNTSYEVGRTTIQFSYWKRDPVRHTSHGKYGKTIWNKLFLKSASVLYRDPNATASLLRETKANSQIVKNLKSGGISGTWTDVCPTLNEEPIRAESSKYSDHVLYSHHEFCLTESNNANLNYKHHLTRMVTAPNPSLVDGDQTQEILYDYIQSGEQNTNKVTWNHPTKLLKEGVLHPCKRGIDQPGVLSSILGSECKSGTPKPGPQAVTEPSIFDTTVTDEIGGSLHLAVGSGADVTSKTETVGLKLAYNRDESITISKLLDINGDNLPDFVYFSSNGVFYCPGSRPDSSVYNAIFRPSEILPLNIESFCPEIKGLPSSLKGFTKSTTNTISISPEIHVKEGEFYGASISDSDAITSVYPSDRDGDGLIDLIINSIVYFNTGPDPKTKIITFVRNVPLIPALPSKSNYDPKKHYPEDIKNQRDLFEAKIKDVLAPRYEKYPFVEVVHMWRAPDAGLIDVVGSMNLPENSLVRISIERNGTIIPKSCREFKAQSGVIAFSMDATDCASNTTTSGLTSTAPLAVSMVTEFDGEFDAITKSDWEAAVATYNFDPSDLTLDETFITAFSTARARALRRYSPFRKASMEEYRKKIQENSDGSLYDVEEGDVIHIVVRRSKLFIWEEGKKREIETFTENALNIAELKAVYRLVAYDEPFNTMAKASRNNKRVFSFSKSIDVLSGVEQFRTIPSTAQSIKVQGIFTVPENFEPKLHLETRNTSTPLTMDCSGTSTKTCSIKPTEIGDGDAGNAFRIRVSKHSAVTSAMLNWLTPPHITYRLNAKENTNTYTKNFTVNIKLDEVEHVLYLPLFHSTFSKQKRRYSHLIGSTNTPDYLLDGYTHAHLFEQSHFTQMCNDIDRINTALDGLGADPKVVPDICQYRRDFTSERNTVEINGKNVDQLEKLATQLVNTIMNNNIALDDQLDPDTVDTSFSSLLLDNLVVSDRGFRLPQPVNPEQCGTALESSDTCSYAYTLGASYGMSANVDSLGNYSTASPVTAQFEVRLLVDNVPTDFTFANNEGKNVSQAHRIYEFLKGEVPKFSMSQFSAKPGQNVQFEIILKNDPEDYFTKEKRQTLFQLGEISLFSDYETRHYTSLNSNASNGCEDTDHKSIIPKKNNQGAIVGYECRFHNVFRLQAPVLVPERNPKNFKTRKPMLTFDRGSWASYNRVHGDAIEDVRPYLDIFFPPEISFGTAYKTCDPDTLPGDKFTKPKDVGETFPDIGGDNCGGDIVDTNSIEKNHNNSKSNTSTGEDRLTDRLKEIHSFPLLPVWLGTLQATVEQQQSYNPWPSNEKSRTKAGWSWARASIDRETAIFVEFPAKESDRYTQSWGFIGPDYTLKQQIDEFRNLVSSLSEETIAKNSESGSANCQLKQGRPCVSGQRLNLFGPLQTSDSTSVSVAAGAGPLNASAIFSNSAENIQFIDISGDGKPESIINGKAHITSPMGAPRPDWIDYYRPDKSKSLPIAQSESFDQYGNSISRSIGLGVNPPTAGLFLTNLVNSLSSGAVEGNFSVSVGANLSGGRNTEKKSLADFNGDGLLDPYVVTNLKDELKIFFNTGATVQKDPTTEFVGLLNPDELDKQNVSRYFGINGGAGLNLNLGYAVNNNSFSGGVGTGYRVSASKALFMDFTADGRVDIALPIHKLDNMAGFMIIPNLGNGYDAKLAKLHFLPGHKFSESSASESTFTDFGGNVTGGVTVAAAKVTFTVGIKDTESYRRGLLQIRDFNADGVPDVGVVKGALESMDQIEISGDPFLYVPNLRNPGASNDVSISYNPDAKTGFLKRVVNPGLSQIEFDYALIGNTGPDHGKSVWSVAEVRTIDSYDPNQIKDAVPGTNIAEDGDDVLAVRHRFRNGHFNRAERAFYGFSKHSAISYGYDKLNNPDIGKVSCVATYESANPNETYLAIRDSQKYRRIDKLIENKSYFTQGRVLSETTSDPRIVSGSDDQLHSVKQYGYSAGDNANIKAEWSTSLSTQVGTSIAEWLKTAVDKNKLPDISTVNQLLSDFKQNYDVYHDSEYRDAFITNVDTARERFSLVSVFGSDRTLDLDSDDGHNFLFSTTESLPSNGVSTLIGYDLDQWGQPMVAYDVGGIAETESVSGKHRLVRAETGYAALDTLIESEKLPPLTKYHKSARPYLGRANKFRLTEGLKSRLPEKAGNKLHRARQAIYKPATGNLSDICQFSRDNRDTLCKEYVELLSDNLQKLPAPKAVKDSEGFLGIARNEGMIHRKIAEYDAFGNPLRGISALSEDGHWVEHRVSYRSDPFASSPTQTVLLRCGSKQSIGSDTPDDTDVAGFKCDYGFLNQSPSGFSLEPDQSIAHRSKSIIDAHFGSVASDTDINNNATLLDLDAWGRPIIFARSFGGRNPGTETTKFLIESARERHHLGKNNSWHPIAHHSYSNTSGIFSSFSERFVSGEFYAGNSGIRDARNSIKSKVATDDNGSLIQSVDEAEVCDIPDINFLDINDNHYCSNFKTARVLQGPFKDALSRSVAEFEPFASDVANIDTPDLVFTKKASSTIPVTSSIYDASNRTIHSISRLGMIDLRKGKDKTISHKPISIQEFQSVGNFLESSQFNHGVHIVDGLPRFSVLSLSPRCTANRSFYDGRGIMNKSSDDHDTGHFSTLKPNSYSVANDDDLKSSQSRIYDATKCLAIGRSDPIWEQSTAWDASQSISYTHDILKQLITVSLPSAKSDWNSEESVALGKISIQYDKYGRRDKIEDVNTGTSIFKYDDLHNLTRETSTGLDNNPITTKRYVYDADRLIMIKYDGGEEAQDIEFSRASDEADSVFYYYDSHPTIDDKWLTDDNAIGWFRNKTTEQDCTNCIGQLSFVSDRPGLKAFQYSELGQITGSWQSILDPRSRVTEEYRPGEEGEIGKDFEISRMVETKRYTSFGDLISVTLSDLRPSNPSDSCIDNSSYICGTVFSLNYRFTPDGKTASIKFNNSDIPLHLFAYDSLKRPTHRKDGNELLSQNLYDPIDLKLNNTLTSTASKSIIQNISYNYEVGGNVLAIQNSEVRPPRYYENGDGNNYSSTSIFNYDNVNRLVKFESEVVPDGINKRQLKGLFAYDKAHRISKRTLLSGGSNGFSRQWQYQYLEEFDPSLPMYPPISLSYSQNADKEIRLSAIDVEKHIDNAAETRNNSDFLVSKPVLNFFAQDPLDDLTATTATRFDGLGRLSSIHDLVQGSTDDEKVLTDRRLEWDAEDRMRSVVGRKRQGRDPTRLTDKSGSKVNDIYSYDYTGSRTVQLNQSDLNSTTISIYSTPYYSRDHSTRGTVQISVDGLPTASIDVPFGYTSDHPDTTYLYADLATGTVNASVRLSGFTDSDNFLLARREYSPYGLAISSDLGAALKGDEDESKPGNGQSALYSFHGKELDPTTGFSNFGSRYYSKDLGIWLSSEPQLGNFLHGKINGGIYNASNTGFYSFAANNPITYSDLSGESYAAPVTSLFAIDLATPEGSDVLWPKWVGWGILIGGAKGLDYLLPEASNPSAPDTNTLINENTRDLGELEPLSEAEVERQKNIEKGIPESALGPSGKPKIHVKNHPTRKRAEEAAQDRSQRGGRPIEHSNPTKGDSHFHPNGSNSREHHTYPNSGFPKNGSTN